MKRTVLFALMILLLLTGCGRGADDEGTIQNWRQGCQTGKLTFSAAITAQTAENVYSCAADCVYNNGETVVTLTEPSTIAGVRFRVGEGDETLSYDGAELLLGDLDGGSVSPCQAVPILMEAIAQGRLLRTWREDDCLAADLEAEEDITVTLWLDGGLLRCAQISQDGRTAAELRIDQWHMEEA